MVAVVALAVRERKEGDERLKLRAVVRRLFFFAVLHARAGCDARCCCVVVVCDVVACVWWLERREAPLLEAKAFKLRRP
jgi:hypothetical protein